MKSGNSSVISVLPTRSLFLAWEEDFTTEITENPEKASVGSVLSVVKFSFGCGSGRANSSL